MPTRKVSEFRAYPWIERKLKLRDWNTANPNRNVKGEVWTQNECLQNAEIAKGLGRQRPEDVVIVASNVFWIIEAKEGILNMDKAVSEAKEYADSIKASSTIANVPFATGVAGSEEEGYEVQNFYKKNGKWELIRVGKSPLSRFLSKKEALRILDSDTSNLERPELSVAEVVQLSNFINETLHIAKVGKEQRALIVAILLLALNHDISIKYKGDPRVFIQDINSRAEQTFIDAGRGRLWDLIQLRPSSETQASLAVALDHIISALKETDVLHAAQGADVLGSFFENFLRYGNSSKELGIVLTPRHICWLAAASLEIKSEDIVYDPAAGTGGFLVAAFNHVRDRVPAQQAKRFAQHNLYGVEVSGTVAALAFINMYFRGDGKHNLKIDSCFDWRIVGNSSRVKTPNFKEGVEKSNTERLLVTKVMMNPPFSLKNDTQKEPDFIDHGLRQLEKNGLLFSVLPASVMYEKTYKAWRDRLLTYHTLAAVVSFPVDLFYPTSTESVGIFVRKGIPHGTDQDVLWARLIEDGFIKKKGFRVERTEMSFQSVLEPLMRNLRAWVVYGTKLAEIPGEYEFSSIRSSELIPQAHLGTPILNSEAFAREVRSTYKNITTQEWDQQQKTGVLYDYSE